MYATFNHNGYSLKSIKTLNTDDGYAFSANLYLNGEKIGNVQNGGSGGPNRYSFTTFDGLSHREANKRQLDILHKIAQETLNEDSEYVEAEDIFIEELLTDIETEKKLKRLCKSSTLVRFKGDDNETYRKIKVLFSPVTKAIILKQAKDRGTEIIEFINESVV